MRKTRETKQPQDIISEVLNRDYRLNEDMWQAVKELQANRRERREAVKAAQERLQTVKAELTKTEEEGHQPNKKRLTKEREELQELIVDHQWYIANDGIDTQPIINQYEAEVRPELNAAIAEAERKVMATMQPYLGALADLTRLKRKRHAIAYEWNQTIEDSTKELGARQKLIKNNAMMPAGLVGNYKARSSHAVEAAKRHHDLLEQDDYLAIGRRNQNEANQKLKEWNEQQERNSYLIKLAQKNEGKTVEEALRQAERDAASAGIPEKATMVSAFDQKQFKADLEEGRRLQEELKQRNADQ